ncbi:transcription antitermination factor NusB [Spiroplasma endosymbiont of Crioceris asparagi]|uniref:transcription antitermination factor NusB n=1 Tax=Spiroplasma endosymbiont of Crioceris asparagi TaxID=3066286 RepID=UPI0030CEC458
MASKIEVREGVVQLLYRYYLLELNKNTLKQEVLDNFQVDFFNEKDNLNMLDLINELEKIESHLSSKLNKSWSWERLAPVARAILVNGYFEINYLNVSKAIVIDKSMDILRKYIPTTDPKFINAILDEKK